MAKGAKAGPGRLCRRGGARPLGIDRQLGVVLTGAQIGCAIWMALGALVVAVGFGLELAVGRVLIARLDLAALGMIPVACGLYAFVRCWLRMSVLGRIRRRPDLLDEVELAFRWGQPAVRVTFRDGAYETLATGAIPRPPLIDAIRRLGAARALPVARVVS